MTTKKKRISHYPEFKAENLMLEQKVLEIPPKGGRKARKAHLDIKYSPVTLKSPANKKEFDNILLYYVGCIEQGENSDKLAWY